MSLKDLIQSEIKVNNIKIKVISKHDGNLIVGDASTLAICQSSKSEYMNMIEGQSIIIYFIVKTAIELQRCYLKQYPFKTDICSQLHWYLYDLNDVNSIYFLLLYKNWGKNVKNYLKLSL